MSISNDYKGHCLTCSYYKPSTNWSDIHSSKGFWCSKHGWQDPYDKCGSYSSGYQSDSYLENCMKEYNRKKHYYIVTTVCNILGLPEDNEYRKMFARIIEEYLIGTIDGEQLLSDYDTFGKEVAWILEMNKNNPTIVELAKEEIAPQFDKMVDDVNNDKVNRAVLRYIILVRRLMQRFSITYEPTNADFAEGLTEYSTITNVYNKTKKRK